MYRCGCSCILIVWIASILTSSIRAKDRQAHPRPNVLVLITDDQRPDTIGALGNAVIRTPNLDLLAKQLTHK